MASKYNILHLVIDGVEIEREPIPDNKTAKQLAEEFKTAYNLHETQKQYELFYYAESSMNKS